MFFGLLYSSSKLYNKPHLIFFESIFLTIISVLLSLFVFPQDYLSFGILVFLTIGSIPIFTKLFSYSSYLSNYQKPFFKRHASLLVALAYFFLGVFVCYVGFFFIFSTNYTLNSYNIDNEIHLEYANQDFYIKITEIHDNSVRAQLYQQNQAIRQGTFYRGQYISFRGYDFDKTFLITKTIKDQEVVLSTGNGIRESIFFVQLKEKAAVDSIRDGLTGNITGNVAMDSSQGSGSAFSNAFSIIFKNNFNVVIKAVLMSFFYGAGAIFLIAWNASVLAGVVASDIFVSMAPVVSEGIKGFFIGLFQSLILFIGYLPHGFPELLAYFLVSFAGAMFARDLFKGMFGTAFKWQIIKDLLFIFLLALLLLVIGALIEASYFI